MTRATRSALPQWLVEPMLAGALTKQEAAEIWKHYQLTTPSDFHPLPECLHQAAQRLYLFEVDPTAPVQ